jgi:hypothetical protein
VCFKNKLYNCLFPYVNSPMFLTALLKNTPKRYKCYK